MNKIISKVLAVGLSVLTAASTTIPAFAATNYKDSTASIVEDINGGDVVGKDENQAAVSQYAEYSDDTAASTDVYVSQKSTFSVVAPVVAVLNGKAGEVNSGNVQYKVFGNIASDEVITVEPDDTFSLSQAGKDDILCTVEAKNAITDFTYANGIRPDNAMTRDYTITANNMTAGSWHGSYNTNISLEQSDINEVLYGKKIKTWDISATEDDDVTMSYYDPSQIVDVPVTANANLLNSITSLFAPLTAYAAEEEPGLADVEQYEDGTVVISGTGNMEEGLYNKFVDIDAFLAEYKSVAEEECGYNVRLEYTGTDLVEILDTLKFYIDDESAGNKNGETYYPDGAPDIENPAIWRFRPKKIVINNGVTNISSRAFVGSSISEVNVPSTVTTIGEGAFSGCTHLKDIEISNGVENIEDGAFNCCAGLTSITIPDSVTKINNGAFSECTNLTSVTIGDGVTEIGYSMFQGFKKLTNVTIGNGVKTIGPWAFAYCTGLTDITFPSSVEEIDSYAFLCCSGLKNLTVCGNITKIDSNAFQMQSTGGAITSLKIGSNVTYIPNRLLFGTLTDIIVDSNNSEYHSQNGVLFNKNKTQLIKYLPTKTEKSYVIPNSVTSIDSSAFNSCTNLTSITIPNSVTSIGASAFYGCKGLTSITIPNSVTSIGASTFYGCKGLTEITIPSGVTTIGNSAFYYCENLKNIFVPSSVTSIESEAFGNIASDSTIYCETQAVADLLEGSYTAKNTTIVVDSSKF